MNEVKLHRHMIARFSACTALAAVAIGLSGGTAFAQDQAQQAQGAEGEANLDTIVVTGSLIRNPNLVSASPVTVVGTDEIQFRQSTNAEELLRDLPGLVPNVGSAVNNGNGGASFVNLRGLGTFRNIVLLNNTRLVPAGLGGTVDLNNIPVALVERVDILTGGASTTYGADAVSGVVNFVTKRDFSGVELNVSDQLTERGDGNQFRVDLTVGANFDDGRGNVAFSVGYQKSDPVFQGDRGFSVNNIDSQTGAAGGSGTTVPTRLAGGLTRSFSGGAPVVFLTSGGPTFTLADGTLVNLFTIEPGTNRRLYRPVDINGNPLAVDANGVAAGTPLIANNAGSVSINPDTGALQGGFTPFNFNPFNIFQTPYTRYNLFSTARYEVADGVEVYSEGLYSKNTVSTIIAPGGAFSFTPDIQIPLSNPFLPAQARNQICARNTAGPTASPVAGLPQTPTVDYVPLFTQAECDAAALATDPDDPNYREANIQVSRRAVETGPRISEFTTQIFNFRVGLRGDLSDSISYDVYGTYGQSENIQRQQGNWLLSRLGQSLQATSPTSCLDPTGGCVPVNLFGPEGSITPEASAFLTGGGVSSSVFTSLGTARALINGDLPFLKSPLSEENIGFALGGEYRAYRGSTSADIPSQTPGEVLGNGAASPPTSGRYSVYELFGELNIPVIEDQFLAKSLTIEAGGRYSHYNNTGTNFTYKAGGTWEPVDGLKIRGDYNRATRSPNLAELFAPQVTGLDNSTSDPCAGSAPTGNPALAAICIAQGAPASAIGSITTDPAGQVNVTGGGNPDLDVERATTWTVGAVIEPKDYLPGFVLTVDYYKIQVTGAITTPTVQDVQDACFSPAFNPTLALTADCVNNIRRNPTTGELFGSPSNTPGYFLGNSNLGIINTDGIDLTASYRRNLGLGSVNFAFNGNYTRSNRFQATPSSIDRECVGFYSPNCGSPAGGTGSIQPKFSWNARTTYSIDRYDVSLLWRRIGRVQYEPLQLETELALVNADLADNGLPPITLDSPDSADVVGDLTDQANRAIGARNYFDLSLRANVFENLTMTFTVFNFTNTKPPEVGSTVGSTAFNSGNTYPSTYDVLGRRYALAAKLKF